jgi:hypothetical protein
MNYKLNSLAALACSSVTALTLAGNAQAIQLNANLGFVPLGSSATFVGEDIGVATQINFPTLNLVNLIPEMYAPDGTNSSANDFFAGGLAPVELLSEVTLTNTLNLQVGESFALGFTAGNNPASFMGSLTTILSDDPDQLDLRFLGSIKGSGFEETDASLSIAFSVTGRGVINYSGTLASIPDVDDDIDIDSETSVPEPGTIVGLLFFGATAVGFRRRQ